jgi:hypothetical protein
MVDDGLKKDRATMRIPQYLLMLEDVLCHLRRTA